MKIRKPLPQKVAFAQIHSRRLSLLAAWDSTVCPAARVKDDTRTCRHLTRAKRDICRAEAGPKATAMRSAVAARQALSSASR